MVCFWMEGAPPSLDAAVAAFRKRRLAEGRRLEEWIKCLRWPCPVPIRPGG